MMTHAVLTARIAKISLTCTAMGLSMLMAGCATDRLDLAPTSYSEPWTPDVNAGASVGTSNFSVPSNPQVAELPPSPTIKSEHIYSLPELIDIAQNQNPDTRIAWQQARQAALAVGMGEAIFLPMISASVIGGYQNTTTPLPYAIGGEKDFKTSGSAVVPALALQWLIFDFGQRSALLEAAKHTSYAANVSFNGMHQKLIYDVTRTYFQYGAAQTQTQIAEQTLSNSLKIQDAAEQRRKNGIATSVEVALARQQVAQSKLRSVVAKGTERDAYLALLGAMGVSPSLAIKVSYAEDRALPDVASPPTEKMIRLALSQRPDVLASYAAAQAASAGIKAAEADFLPKVYLAGAVAGGDGRFDIQGLPGISQQTSSSSILVGVSVPIYDGGIRAARVKEAESRAAAAAEGFKKTQELAVREIVVAADTLRSALESNQAALELVKTSFIAYDAALESYRNGVGTITVANEAANGLLNAQQMSTDAHAASLVAAANLAFVMGKMTRASEPL
ncbi:MULTISPECIES: TolC family protein [Yersinia]|uniref:TolC family protein n=1 Tax=Yersinia TaxID=629 RepID=UPI000FFCB546|nr:MULTISPECIES: TolC family protein [Yersinia]RXA94436.1 TolC family protein [Yersinia sp. 2105 StPb PI]